MPVPRLSNTISRENEASRVRNRASRGSSQATSTWETKPGHENEIDRAVTDHLIRDADRTAPGVPRLRLHHGIYTPSTTTIRQWPAPSRTEHAAR